MGRDARTPTLIVFGGLPGTGKTTLARALARDLGATYLRIDEIEQAIRDSGLNSEEVGVSGYRVGYALAESNLRLGAAVVADSVNPLRITRLSWRSVAEKASARIVEIEIICSDIVEHRRRVDSRHGDISGLLLPTWQQITERSYEEWDSDRIVIDTAHCSPEVASAQLSRAMAALGQRPGH